MTTYKVLKGTNIQVKSDPTYPIDGEVWYDSTNNVLKGNKGTPVAAWETTNSMNTGRYGMGSAGVQTSALGFGGNGPSTQTAVTESWNGTNWTEVNDLNQAKHYVAGAGVSNTSALAFGGNADGAPAKTDTETWNGTNWTEVNNLNTGRNGLSGAGADNTSAVAFGGTPPDNLAITELWNGTNWTEVNDLNVGRTNSAGAGTNTLALAFGGSAPSVPGRTTSSEAFTGATTVTFTDS